MARLTRAEFRSLKEKEYVLAARSEGYGHLKIVFREILPNAMPSIVAGTSVMVANAILMESAMSFIGLGDPNAVSWGSMIGAGREVLRSYWYLTAIPGAFIVITVLSLNVLADRLNQMLNPQQRQHETESSHLVEEKA
ncbi:Oligopeptide transport system permease protein OppC [compost metagenome]